MKTWFNFDAKASQTDTVEVSIFDEIGAWGVTAKDFIAALRGVDTKNIVVSINSPGGSVFDALAIYNALRQHDANVTTKVMGVAASAASVIAMAGDKIVMPANTFMMIHNPLTGIYGNADELRDMADVLDKIGASLVATYVSRTGLSDDEVKALLDNETWLSAEDAVAQGFADEIEPALAIAASYDTDRLPEHIRAAFTAASDDAGAGSGDDTDNAEGDTEGGTTDTPEAFADTVLAIATAHGFGDLAAVWALDERIGTVEAATAAVMEAREIRSLCVVANQSDKATAFIRARKSLADVRIALLSHFADVDAATHTSKFGNSKPSQAAQPAALKTADIWAARNSQRQ